jgi:hypothetical protein
MYFLSINQIKAEMSSLTFISEDDTLRVRHEPGLLQSIPINNMKNKPPTQKIYSLHNRYKKVSAMT